MLTQLQIIGPIKIVAISFPTITFVSTSQHFHSLPNGPVDLSIFVHLKNCLPNTPKKYTLQIELQGNVVFQTGLPKAENNLKEIVDTMVKIEEPKLWWPSGYGTQDLYTIRASVVDTVSKLVLSNWEGRIGLRHLELDTTPDVSHRKCAQLYLIMT